VSGDGQIDERRLVLCQCRTIVAIVFRAIVFRAIGTIALLFALILDGGNAVDYGLLQYGRMSGAWPNRLSHSVSIRIDGKYDSKSMVAGAFLPMVVRYLP